LIKLINILNELGINNPNPVATVKLEEYIENEYIMYDVFFSKNTGCVGYVELDEENNTYKNVLRCPISSQEEKQDKYCQNLIKVYKFKNNFINHDQYYNIFIPFKYIKFENNEHPQIITQQ